MREEYVHVIYVLGCGIPWWTPRGALLIKCSEQNAMSMPSLGVNVVSIGASILMSSHTSKNKKETSRRTDSAQSYMQQLCVTARVQPLVRWHGHSLVSTHSLGKNLDYALAAVCGSMHACSHLCVGMGIRLVQDHKANTSLTKLNLSGNKVGDVGATVLAEAVKATVLTCGQMLFRALAFCCHRCHFSWWCEQLASSCCYAVCVAAFAFFLVS